jgi:preprotein translocase subunit SecD
MLWTKEYKWASHHTRSLSLSGVGRTLKYMCEVLLPLVHSLDSDATSTEFNSDLITNRHRVQLGLDNKETLRFGNRKMKRLPEIKSVSANTRLIDSKSNLTAKVYSDSAKTVMKRQRTWPNVTRTQNSKRLQLRPATRHNRCNRNSTSPN